jgi:ABC-type sugar transport system ATPase subunit
MAPGAHDLGPDSDSDGDGDGDGDGGGGPPIVRFTGIGKQFPGVQALRAISFDIMPGSCHALCGENGAGKSTLAKILAGILQPDAGELRVDGRRVTFNRPRDALAAGIGLVHQELSSCENLSVAENLCLGTLPARRLFVARGELRRRAAAMLAAIDADIDVRRPVGTLPLGQQQMVQIAAAVGNGARVIIFDEPTSSLSEHEAERLYALMARLRARGVTSVYVSHRMAEIFRLCDTITVLRDGAHVTTQPARTLDEATLVELMIGRRLDEYLPRHVSVTAGAELLRVDRLSSPGKFHDVSFELRAGEVVGLAGLVGAGRSEIAQALFGLDPGATGGVAIGGQAVRLTTPRQAMRLGLGLVPEDRKRQGLVLGMRAVENLTLPILPALSRFGWIRRADERALAQRFHAMLGVRAPSIDFVTAGLSGGNQQKIVLAKWLAARCRVLILDEPTRGVDVGAKAEIHGLIDRLAAEGNGVLLISSELPELIALSTRILVVRAGALVGEVPRALADQSTVMRLMAGVNPRSSAAAP